MNWEHFFNKKTIRFTVPFPYTGIKNICSNNLNTFLYTCKTKGQTRQIAYMGKQYNYCTSGIDEIINMFMEYEWMKNRDNNKFFSATNIYNSDLLKNSNFTYSKLMYKKWCEFNNELIKGKEIYKYSIFSYIDIEGFYKNIYSHFINILACDDFEKILLLKDRKHQYTIEYNLKNKKLIKFEEKFTKNICYMGETNGIPLGNGLSDFISEMLLLKTEDFVQKKFCHYKFRIIRYRDDIIIMSNNKKINQEIYNYFLEILASINLHINTEKSKININFNKLYEKISYKKEEDKFKKIYESNYDFELIKKTIEKFPNSNKIFTLFKNLLNFEHFNQIKKLVKFVLKKSQTNIVPWVCALLLKRVEKKEIKKILKKININLLTESDKYWFFFLLKKINLKNKMYKDIEKFIYKTNPNIFKQIDIAKLNLSKDADLFNYFFSI